MKSAKSLLQQWPSREELAADVGAGRWAVSKWFWRDRIPAEFWAPLAKAAKARGIRGVTVESLAVLHARRSSRSPARTEARA